ncbi:MAG TPA: DUF1992 domain-containing protein [Tepidisphaeraceae bacterium]|nr:DUF1992 domain-containing protein [Tepidisphaeraceae bacterium]
MGLKDIEISNVLRRLADKRVEDAIAEGKFDNLPGAGQPIDLEPMPADENARAAWWALRIMKNANVTPDEVLWRKAVDRLKDQLAVAKSESEVNRLVTEINGLVRKVNTLGTNALKAGLAPLDAAVEVARFRGGENPTGGA